MSQQYPNNWKQCATCAYWTGARETDNLCQRVYVDSPMSKGRCMLRGGAWFRYEKQANASCNSFEKWPVLR
ncbi:MAG: hypothetical protein IJL97_03165 [Lachnospiraceae bacterium]|nr:hypothetical protein [Lachnospiraceae bacterium]